MVAHAYRISSIKPGGRRGGEGALFISSPSEGCFIETGGLFNLEKTMVSVLHKELEYKAETLR